MSRFLALLSAFLALPAGAGTCPNPLRAWNRHYEPVFVCFYDVLPTVPVSYGCAFVKPYQPGFVTPVVPYPAEYEIRARAVKLVNATEWIWSPNYSENACGPGFANRDTPMEPYMALPETLAEVP